MTGTNRVTSWRVAMQPGTRDVGLLAAIKLALG
jgi:hypothetical protein